MIPIGDSPHSRSVPHVTRALLVANALVFLFMLTLSTSTSTSRGQAQAQFDEQTAGIPILDWTMERFWLLA